MPYVPGHPNRFKFKALRDVLFDPKLSIEGSGELTYLMTLLWVKYLKANGLRYQHISDIDGAHAGSLRELNRRVAGFYEDGAIRRNGDIEELTALETGARGL